MTTTRIGRAFEYGKSIAMVCPEWTEERAIEDFEMMFKSKPGRKMALLGWKAGRGA